MLIKGLYNLLLVFILKSVLITNYFYSNTVWTVNDFNNCKISNEDALTFPWAAGIRISIASEKDAYWPVVIISSHTLITDGRSFRAPDRKLRILPPTNYTLSLKNVPVPHEPNEDDQLLEVSYVKPHPAIGATIAYWMKAENDIVLIHLKTPIIFTRTIRPLCLPLWNSSHWSRQNESIIEPGQINLITGWKCKYYFALAEQVAAFDIEIKNYDECSDVWTSQAEFAFGQDVEYKNRVCGVPTVWNQSRFNDDLLVHKKSDYEPDPGFCGEKCYFTIQTINEDERVLVGTFNGIAPQIFTGPTGYISLLTPSMISWIQHSIDCGPSNYTCNNGQCIPLSLRCNKVQNCDDGSDEDPIYCRALNYCTASQFACGVYGPCITNVNAHNCNGVKDCEDGEDEDESICTQPANTWFQNNWPYIIFIPLAVLCMVVAVGSFFIRQSINKSQMYLSEVDMLEFRQGISNSQESGFRYNGRSDHDDEDDKQENVQLNSMQMPYIYDIALDKFKLGKQVGSGAFGDVYEGHVEGKIVAIKVLKKGLVDKDTFKTFLAELKVMAYVQFIKGGHDNIIRLIGAYTDEIRTLKLYIALEYCQFGSISDYLKENKTYFEEAIEEKNYKDNLNFDEEDTPAAVGYVKAVSLQSTFNLETLDKWFEQIVDDSNLTAKISDFGLSRQIYYYNLSSCVHLEKDAQLPWRWLAPEVIHCLKISTASDLWSFGVTMWEIYSLGRIPYGGLEWTPNFIDQLKCGLRLPKPEYASDDKYTIIQDCWKYYASSRPNFETVKERLKNCS